MIESFLSAKGIIFLEPIPIDLILNLSDCQLFHEKDKFYAIYRGYNYLVNYEVNLFNPLILESIKSIYIDSLFNSFQSEEMLRLVYSIIKNTDFKFEIILDPFFIRQGMIKTNMATLISRIT